MFDVLEASGGAAVPVDDPVPRRGEQPGPEAGLIPLEPRQRAQDSEPGVRSQVLGNRTCLDGQVAEEARVELLPQQSECVLVAALGGAEIPAEIARCLRLTVG